MKVKYLQAKTRGIRFSQWKSANLSDFEEVASVTVGTLKINAALEGAFKKTNTIEDDWWTNPGVVLKPGIEYENLRSSSVGDVFVLYWIGQEEGRYFQVARVGFLSLVRNGQELVVDRPVQG